VRHNRTGWLTGFVSPFHCKDNGYRCYCYTGYAAGQRHNIHLPGTGAGPGWPTLPFGHPNDRRVGHSLILLQALATRPVSVAIPNAA